MEWVGINEPKPRSADTPDAHRTPNPRLNMAHAVYGLGVFRVIDVG